MPEPLSLDTELASIKLGFRDLAEAVPQMICIAGRDGTASYFNSQWREFTGRTPASFWESIHPEDEEAVLECWQQALVSGNGFERELRLRDANHEYRWFLGRVRPMLNSDGAIGAWLTACTDIGELKGLQEHARRAERRGLIDRYTDIVLRDFLNLLTVITGYAEFSLYGLDEGEDVRERIQEIRRGAERATHLVYTCLSVGRRETPSSARILDLNQSLKDAEKVLEPLTGDNTVMELHLHSSLLPVRMCPAELERVILNLVINAREAMPDGGTVTIQTANMLIDNQAIASQIGVATGQYVTLLLSDTGIGMDVETRRHLFEPFFTTKENHRGLGLATVRGIVKQSAGGIVVESESGQGTRVTVYLPAVMQGAVVPVNASPQLVRSLAGTETILVADANLQMRILVRKMLEHAGYRVLEAESGKPAFNIPDGIESPIDLLLTEVGMRGRLLASQLQRRNPKVKILYMCRHDDNEVRPLAEGKAYIQKPFSPHILWHMIRGLLDRT